MRRRKARALAVVAAKTTPNTATFLERRCAYKKCSTCGASSVQGVHQLAKKSTTTYRPRIEERLTGRPLTMSRPATPGAGLLRSGVGASAPGDDDRVARTAMRMTRTTPTPLEAISAPRLRR